MTRLFTILEAAIDAVVRRIILPIADAIPVLVRTGLLFAGFAVLWAVFLGAMVLQPEALDAAWAWLTGLPLLLGGIVWLLFLPLAGALWVWSTDWPLILRVAIVLGIAGWNLFMFLPRRETSSSTATSTPPGATSTSAEA